MMEMARAYFWAFCSGFLVFAALKGGGDVDLSALCFGFAVFLGLGSLVSAIKATRS